MELTDVNVLVAIISGLLGIYAGYKKALAYAQKNGQNEAKIIIMLENLTTSYEKMDKKLDDSIDDRHKIKVAIGVHEEQILNLIEKVDKIESNCKECRKKCD